MRPQKTASGAYFAAEQPFPVHAHVFCPHPQTQAAPGLQFLQYAFSGLHVWHPATNAARPATTATASMFFMFILPSFRLYLTLNTY